MRSRTVRARGVTLLAAVVGALSLGAAGEALAAAPTKLATCDQSPGVTVRTSLKWRLFRPRPSSDFDDPGAIWVCLRGAAPARRFAELDYIFRTVHKISGDLAYISNSGRYTSESYVLNLATLRLIVIDDDWSTNGLLTGSGAVVSQTSSRTQDPQTGRGATTIGAVAIDDASGRHELLPDATIIDAPAGSSPSTTPAAGASGSLNRAVAVSGGDDLPGGVVYASAADGTPVRFAPTGAVDSSAWPARKMRYFARTFRRPLTREVRTTPLLGAGYELSRRRAGPGRPASLTIRRPANTAYNEPTRASDLVARLAPGSGADARVTDAGIIIGRFRDSPGDVRARLLSSVGPNGAYLLDQPAPLPAASGAIAFSRGVGTVAIASADVITLVIRDSDTGQRSIRTLAARGATQLAMFVTASGRTYDHVVYWTGADGRPGSHAFSIPE